MKCFSSKLGGFQMKLIVIRTNVLFFFARLISTSIWTGAGADAGATAGWGRRTWAEISIIGADHVEVDDFRDWQQLLQIQSLTTKMRITAAIMAAGEVKAQCGSGVFMWSSLSSRIVVSNSLLYLFWVLRWPYVWFLCFHSGIDLWVLWPNPWSSSWSQLSDSSAKITWSIVLA
jgi:hypothetical protein